MNRVDLSVQRNDLTGYLRDFVNEAQGELQKLRDWTFCHKILPITIPNGQGEIQLFADFKSLGDEPAVFLIGGQGIKNPCKTLHRASFFAKQARNILTVPFVPPLYNSTFNFPLWWDIIDDTPFLGLPAGVPAQGDMNFEISYYRYLPELIEPEDMNAFTRHHFQMLVDMARHFAFKSINDPLKDAALSDAMITFKVAAAKDDHIKLAGVSLRMGG